VVGRNFFWHITTGGMVGEGCDFYLMVTFKKIFAMRYIIGITGF
jgi:hypothetical protein